MTAEEKLQAIRDAYTSYANDEIETQEQLLDVIEKIVKND